MLFGGSTALVLYAGVWESGRVCDLGKRCSIDTHSFPGTYLGKDGNQTKP